MHTSSSPASGRATGAHSRRRGKTENIDTESIQERAPTGNRQLLERAGKVRLWALTEGRRTRYEVEAGEAGWSFNLLFSAISKFDRLARKGAAKP
jgi:hypothetical protein